ncbi:MAG: phospholipase D-like domain-containing protein [Candidatus Marsarchaeota archaeon]|jgi:phosphatidylserine/phosphatidylglycerophosphate/cardiolipin synthase-like enzyme|nr:phospholipase D-like domain-containing protein [Candidatus Marsarchaeota archaeon]
MRAISTESSYKAVDKLLFSKGRNLYIISPFVSEYYLKMLKRLSSRKNVYLITSESSYSKAVEYAGSRLAGTPKISHAAIVAATVALTALAKQYMIALLAIDMLGIWAAFFTVAMLSPKRKSRMHVKIVRGNFVHEKVYIGENRAITGSANLTYSGMHKNTERIEIIDDKKEVKELRRHFEDMWHKAVS